MQDLSKIKEPFGSLDCETQKALMAHNGPYEFWDGRYWCFSRRPGWAYDVAYRVKPV